MSAPLIVVKPELHVPGRMLGRHVEHDPQSRMFAARVAKRKPVSRKWENRSGILDQDLPKPLGSCVGNTFAEWLGTDTKDRRGRTDITEDVAVRIYEVATTLDRIPGAYPPEDTGSSGLGGAKALVKLGLARGPYRHTFSLNAALLALSFTGPLCVGIDWPEGMDTPSKTGQIRFTGKVRGGHEQLWDEIDVEKGRVWMRQSWGDWGLDGRAWLTIDDFGKALAAQGDVVVMSI